MQMPSAGLGRLVSDEDDEDVEGQRECMRKGTLDVGADSGCRFACPAAPPPRPPFRALHGRAGSQDGGDPDDGAFECAVFSDSDSDSAFCTSGAFSASGSESEVELEAEDATDYSFPALARARALQGRRHAAHPLSVVLGVRGALGPLVRVVGCVAVVAVLAGGGRWS